MKTKLKMWEVAKQMRSTWDINPVTRVVPDNTKYNRKKQKKNWLKELV